MKLVPVWAVVALAVGLSVGPAIAADKPGLLLVVDDAELFSAGAKKQAEKKMSGTKFDRGLNLNVTTVKEMPAEWKKKYDDGDKEKVLRDWAKSVATKDKAKGPFVLICMKPDTRSSWPTKRRSTAGSAAQPRARFRRSSTPR